MVVFDKMQKISIKNKKALSTIVANLIIILLTLVAIGILWGVLHNIISKGSQDVDLQKITINFDIKSASFLDSNITVIVQRNSVEGNVTGLRFIFTNSTKSVTIDRFIQFDELDTKTFIFNSTEVPGIGIGDTISVSPIYDSYGSIKVGNPSTKFVIKGIGSETETNPGDGSSDSEGSNNEFIPGVTVISIGSCGEITAPGYYNLSNDIVSSNSNCLNIHDTNQVFLNCNGYSISLNTASAGNRAVSIQNVNNFSIESCIIKVNSNTSPPALYLVNSSLGIFDNNTFTANNNTWVSILNGSNLQILNNIFNNTEYEQNYLSSNNLIENNKLNFTWSYNGAALIIISGSNNIIRGNFMEGKGGRIGGTGAFYGIDDGIVLQNTTGALVENNIIYNFWDCSIETLFLVQESTIQNNILKNATVCAVGGWYFNSWKGNRVLNNVADNVGFLFLFYRIYGLQPGEDNMYFEDNVFSGNILTNNNPVQVFSSYIYLDASAIIPLENIILGNNQFINNDFDTTQTAPYMWPKSLGIVDGGNNICGNINSELTSFLSCDSSIIPPSLSINVNPLTVSIGENSTATWTSSNADVCYFSDDIPVTSVGSRNLTYSTLTTSYNLTCANRGGSTVKPIPVTVS